MSGQRHVEQRVDQRRLVSVEQAPAAFSHPRNAPLLRVERRENLLHPPDTVVLDQLGQHPLHHRVRLRQQDAPHVRFVDDPLEDLEVEGWDLEALRFEVEVQKSVVIGQHQQFLAPGHRPEGVEVSKRALLQQYHGKRRPKHRVGELLAQKRAQAGPGNVGARAPDGKRRLAEQPRARIAPTLDPVHVLEPLELVDPGIVFALADSKVARPHEDALRLQVSQAVVRGQARDDDLRPRIQRRVYLIAQQLRTLLVEPGKVVEHQQRRHIGAREHRAGDSPVVEARDEVGRVRVYPIDVLPLEETIGILARQLGFAIAGRRGNDAHDRPVLEHRRNEPVAVHMTAPVIRRMRVLVRCDHGQPSCQLPIAKTFPVHSRNCVTSEAGSQRTASETAMRSTPTTDSANESIPQLTLRPAPWALPSDAPLDGVWRSARKLSSNAGRSLGLGARGTGMLTFRLLVT